MKIANFSLKKKLYIKLQRKRLLKYLYFSNLCFYNELDNNTVYIPHLTTPEHHVPMPE